MAHDLAHGLGHVALAPQRLADPKAQLCLVVSYGEVGGLADFEADSTHGCACSMCFAQRDGKGLGHGEYVADGLHALFDAFVGGPPCPRTDVGVRGIGEERLCVGLLPGPKDETFGLQGDRPGHGSSSDGMRYVLQIQQWQSKGDARSGLRGPGQTA